jgi:hypothetical protein
MSVFTQLCDIVDDLSRLVRDLDPGPTQMALEVLVDRLDCCIDATIGLEVPALEEEDTDA